MRSFDLKLIQIKLQFKSVKVILSSEVSHVWSKSSYSENFTFSALLCEQM